MPDGVLIPAPAITTVLVARPLLSKEAIFSSPRIFRYFKLNKDGKCNANLQVPENFAYANMSEEAARKQTRTFASVKDWYSFEALNSRMKI